MIFTDTNKKYVSFLIKLVKFHIIYPLCHIHLYSVFLQVNEISQ